MSDVALILDGVVAQVWRKASAADLPPPDTGQLVEFPEADEVAAGKRWDGAALALPAPDLAVLAATKRAEVHAEAERRILALVDERTQRRWFGRGLKLIMTIGVDPSDWPSEDRDLLAQALTAQAAVEAIEAAEVTIAAAVPTDDAAAIAAFDVAANPAWP